MLYVGEKMAETSREAICAAASVIVLLVYHLWLAVRKQGTGGISTAQGLMAKARTSWLVALDNNRFTHKRDLRVEEQYCKGMLPVNTLRDIIRSATFLAAAASALVAAVAGFASQSPRLACISSASLSECGNDSILLLAKFLVLLGTLVAIFFNFGQTARYMTHTRYGGHLITCDRTKAVKQCTD